MGRWDGTQDPPCRASFAGPADPGQGISAELDSAASGPPATTLEFQGERLVFGVELHELFYDELAFRSW